MPCGGDATQEREFQPKCSRFPCGMLLGRKELPCKSAWTRTGRSLRPVARSPSRRCASRRADHCAGIEIESRGYLWKSDSIWSAARPRETWRAKFWPMTVGLMCSSTNGTQRPRCCPLSGESRKALRHRRKPARGQGAATNAIAARSTASQSGRARYHESTEPAYSADLPSATRRPSPP